MTGLGITRASLTQRLHNVVADEARRDEEILADLVGEGDTLRRARAEEVLGTGDEVVARLTAAELRGKARRTGALSPEDAERLVAAEEIVGTRTDLGREAEALLAAARADGLA